MKLLPRILVDDEDEELSELAPRKEVITAPQPKPLMEEAKWTVEGVSVPRTSAAECRAARSAIR